MVKESALVSVVITTYNRPEYLKLAIQSVLNQTYKNIEILVIDDGSIGSVNEDICRSLGDFIYIKTRNTKTPATGRNIGIQKSNGEYIAFLDDDDLWLPNKIEIQLKILENNTNFGLVHSPCQIIDSNGNLKSKIIGESFEWRNKHGDVSLNMLGNFGLMMPTPLIRKSIVNKVGFFNDKMKAAGEDTEFWCRCSFETKFYYYEKPLAYYRVHADSVSDKSKEYINLPIHLAKIARNQLKKNKISLRTYYLLTDNCLRLQRNYGSYNYFYAFINTVQIYLQSRFRI